MYVVLFGEQEGGCCLLVAFFFFNILVTQRLTSTPSLLENG